MKNLLIILFVVSSVSTILSQDRIWLDLEGNKIDKDIFLKVWRSPEYSLSRWDYIGSDGIRYAQLTQYEFELGNYDYKIVRSELKKLTNKEIPDSTILLIVYKFKDDLCSRTSSNNWSRSRINERKEWFQKFKSKLKKNKVTYVWLFEKGMQLNTKKNKKNEFFFIDENDFFRKRIFANETLCGSAGIIKANGQILVRKGEGSINQLLEVLKTRKWSKFFENTN